MAKEQNKPQNELRTGQQNRATHLYCTWLSDKLNARNLPPAKVLKESVEIVWTKSIVIAMAEVLTEFLNASGSGPLAVFKHSGQQYWTMQIAKELLWRQAQIHVLKKFSTTRLKKQEDIDCVYDIINRRISERFGIAIPFPNKEDLMQEEVERLERLRKSAKSDSSI